MGFAALIVVLLGMFVPMANKMVFETVIPAGAAADLAPIAGLLVGAAVVIMLTTYIRNLYIVRVENIVEMNLHNAVMARLFLLPPKFFHTYSSGELTSKLNNLSNLCQQINETTVGALLNGVLSVVYFIQVGIYGGPLLLPAMALFALQALILVLYFRKATHVQQALHRQERCPQRYGVQPVCRYTEGQGSLVQRHAPSPSGSTGTPMQPGSSTTHGLPRACIPRCWR